MNTRHVIVVAVDEPEGGAIAQVDEVVTASTVVGRRPGVVHRPAYGSKRTSAGIIQA